MGRRVERGVIHGLAQLLALHSLAPDAECDEEHDREYDGDGSCDDYSKHRFGHCARGIGVVERSSGLLSCAGGCHDLDQGVGRPIGVDRQGG